jgi:hypothetical protein
LIPTASDLLIEERSDEHERLGPIPLPLSDGTSLHACCDRYLDSYSIFDWGRMPDSILGKGAAAAVIGDWLLSRMECAASWVEFSKGVHALLLRKGNRFGSVFNEVGESLQTAGLTTYRIGLGAVHQDGFTPMQSFLNGGARHWLRQTREVPPATATLLGRPVHTYINRRTDALPVMLPFEFRFHFQLGAEEEEGSILHKLKRDPGYLSRRGFKTTSTESGRWLDFPVLEIFTVHESVRRSIELEEALAISTSLGFSLEQLQRTVLLTAWVGGFFRQEFEAAQIQLRGGNMRWAIGPQGESMLASTPGTHNLDLEVEGQRLHLRELEHHHLGTPWAKSVQQARELSGAIGEQGVKDPGREWKKRVPIGPRPLTPEGLEWATQLHPMLANRLTRKNWFSGAWSLETVCQKGKLWKAREANHARTS